MKNRIWKRIGKWAAVAIVLLICLSLYGYFVNNAQVFRHIYVNASRDSKVVALTFDDGPNEPYTSQILDVLKEKGVKATFFLIGKNAEMYPEIAKRILAQGHVIGNHSYSHWNHHALTSFGMGDLEKNETALYNLLGVKPHFCRPTFGRKSPWELAAVKNNGMEAVNWDVFANDLHIHHAADDYWAGRFAGHIVKDTKGGSIVLLHDGFGTVHDGKFGADKSLIVLALPKIIDQFRAKGYTLVTVPELLKIRAYNNQSFGVLPAVAVQDNALKVS